jgi:hypothetical protein
VGARLEQMDGVSPLERSQYCKHRFDEHTAGGILGSEPAGEIPVGVVPGEVNAGEPAGGLRVP